MGPWAHPLLQYPPSIHATLIGVRQTFVIFQKLYCLWNLAQSCKFAACAEALNSGSPDPIATANMPMAINCMLILIILYPLHRGAGWLGRSGGVLNKKTHMEFADRFAFPRSDRNYWKGRFASHVPFGVRSAVAEHEGDGRGW